MRPTYIVALLAFSTAAMAAGPLPLREGTYVLHGTPCADPPFAAMRSYDGIGLGDPHSHACRARIVAQRGPRFVVDNSCIGAGVGAAPRTTERLAVTVTSREAFAIGAGRTASRYEYCPARALPVSLHQRGGA